MKIRVLKYSKENIEEVAQRNGRSYVAEILFRLKLSLGMNYEDNEQ